MSYETSVQIRHLEELLSGLLAFSNGLLDDFLAVHESVCYSFTLLVSVVECLWRSRGG